MTKKILPIRDEHFENLIYELRGHKVMLDSDLARVYGVQTKALNQAVKRNSDRFPEDFVFQLSSNEAADIGAQIVKTNRSQNVTGNLKSQSVTSSWGGRRKSPYAFTEHGALMAANVLKSSRATQMSVFVIRAFVRMRVLLSDTRDHAKKLAALETELKGRLNVHEAAIVTILQRVMDIIDPPPMPVPPKRRKIGFREEDK